jgi:hypothetical protein
MLISYSSIVTCVMTMARELWFDYAGHHVPDDASFIIHI